MGDIPDNSTGYWIVTIITAILTFLGGAGISWYNAISKNKKIARKEDLDRARKDLEDIITDLRKELDEKESRVNDLMRQVLELSTRCAKLESDNNHLINLLNKVNENNRNNP